MRKGDRVEHEHWGKGTVGRAYASGSVFWHSDRGASFLHPASHLELVEKRRILRIK